MATVILNDSLKVVEPDERNTATFEQLDVLYPYAQREVEKKDWSGSHTVLEDAPESVLVLKSNDKPVSIMGASKHHLMNAILYAYNNHIGLRLTPDDILQCFSSVAVQCINDNSEKYRDVFVNHQGKKKLVVVADCEPGKFDWSELTDLMSEEIDENVKTSLGLESEFTTSTTVTRTVSQMMKMAAFKSYFSYGFMMQCGVRKVQLTGTLDDWLKLREKVAKCVEIFTSKGDMVNWSRHFMHVLNMLIETYKSVTVEAENKSDTGLLGILKSLVTTKKPGSAPSEIVDFWSRIITYIPYGSGGQQYISGWAKVLFPGTKYNKFPEKMNLLDMSSEPPSSKVVNYYTWQDQMAKWAQVYGDDTAGLSRVEAELNDHGLVYDFCCTIGHLGWNVDGDFSYGELGYVVHAVAKDKPEVTAKAEKGVIDNGVSPMTSVATAERKDGLEQYRELQKIHLAKIQEYQAAKLRRSKYDD